MGMLKPEKINGHKVFFQENIQYDSRPPKRQIVGVMVYAGDNINNSDYIGYFKTKREAVIWCKKNLAQNYQR